MFYMDAENLGDIDFADLTQTPLIARMSYEEPEMKSVMLRVMPELMFKGILDA